MCLVGPRGLEFDHMISNVNVVTQILQNSHGNDRCVARSALCICNTDGSDHDNNTKMRRGKTTSKAEDKTGPKHEALSFYLRV